MQKKIILHGHLAEKYPHEITVEAETVAEAVRSLQTIEELKPPVGSPWPIRVQGIDSEIALFAKTSLEEIHIYPNLGGGGGRGGVLQILIGVALIAVGFAFPAFAFLGMNASSLFLAGGLMITGGILQMLLPNPDGSDESESSRYLGSTANTAKIGTKIPLGYGNRKLGGHYLSFDVDAIEYNDDGWEGASTIVDDSVFVQYDDPGITPVTILPIFSSDTPGVGNVPTSGWVAA